MQMSDCAVLKSSNEILTKLTHTTSTGCASRGYEEQGHQWLEAVMFPPGE